MYLGPEPDARDRDRVRPPDLQPLHRVPAIGVAQSGPAESGGPVDGDDLRGLHRAPAVVRDDTVDGCGGEALRAENAAPAHQRLHGEGYRREHTAQGRSLGARGRLSLWA